MVKTFAKFLIKQTFLRRFSRLPRGFRYLRSSQPSETFKLGILVDFFTKAFPDRNFSVSQTPVSRFSVFPAKISLKTVYL